MSVRCQLIVIIIIDTAFFVVLTCVCTGGVVNCPAIQGKLARHGATPRKVSTRRHLFFTGVLCVACRLCVCLFFFWVCLLPGLVFVFPCYIFFLSLFLLCVHRTEPHKATRTVSTRGHVLVTGVLCVACLLCVRFALLFFLFVCVLLPLQVEDSRFKCMNVKTRYVLHAQFVCFWVCSVFVYVYV